MKLNNHVESLGFAATLAVAFLLILSPLFAATPIVSSGSGQDRFGLRGDVKIYVDGVLVAENHNVISLFHYDVIACKVYNSTAGGCSPSGFVNNTNNIALNAIALSTSSATDTAASATGCAGVITGSNLDPTVATVTHVSNDNQVSLTASWIANASVTSIQKACLYSSDGTTPTGAPYDENTATYAATHFTAININNGQSLSITWTFSY